MLTVTVATATTNETAPAIRAVNSSLGTTTAYVPGRVLNPVAGRRKDWPIDAIMWTTSTDIDLMHIISADAVELADILGEDPRLTDLVEPLHDRLARHFPEGLRGLIRACRETF